MAAGDGDELHDETDQDSAGLSSRLNGSGVKAFPSSRLQSAGAHIQPFHPGRPLSFRFPFGTLVLLTFSPSTRRLGPPPSLLSCPSQSGFFDEARSRNRPRAWGRRRSRGRFRRSRFCRGQSFPPILSGCPGSGPAFRPRSVFGAGRIEFADRLAATPSERPGVP